MPLDLIRLPKAELHLHIEGTLEPETVLEFAETNGVRLPFADEDALRAAYDFANLQEFLDLYYAAMETVITAADFHTMASRYYERAAAQGVRHAEIFLDPQAHLSRGVRWESMMDGITAAVTDAQRRHGITGGVIACILRDRPVAEARATYELVRADRHRFLGIGLDSAELPYPPELFTDLWRQAKADGFLLVAHAGEEGPAAYIWTALDALGVDRVDHGIRAVDDPALIGALAQRGTPLTVCPLSNVALKTVPDLGHHPLLSLLEQGVTVTVNSDDPAYFGGYVADNYLAMRVAGMTDAQALRLAHNSVTGSFADAARAAALHAEIDAFATT